MDVKMWCEAIGKKQVKGREEKQSEGEDQDKDEMVQGGKEKTNVAVIYHCISKLN